MVNIRSLPSAAWVAILAVIAATTFGPITIRYAQLAGAPSIYIIVVRLLLTSLLLVPFVWRKNTNAFGQMSARNWLWAGLAGFFLVFNLLMLMFALEFTSVLVTGMLRRLSPLWVIGLEIAFLSAIFRPRVWVGIVITVAGSMLVALATSGAIEPGSAPVLGAVLAIIGSICMGLYLLIGRNLRDALSSLAYSWLVFTIAGLLALVLAVATDVPLWGYSLQEYFWVLMSTLVAQVVGHIALNQTLQYVPATYISLIMQLSIVASGVVAYFAFNQIPSLWQGLGCAAIIVGVVIATWQK